MSQALKERIATIQAILDDSKKCEVEIGANSLPRLITELSELAGSYPSINLAVEICCGMYRAMQAQSIEKGSDPDTAHEAGCLGYRSSMPKLAGADNVRDFIACVVHGLSTGIIAGQEGTRLLYAAQVAHSALPSPMQRKRRDKTAQIHTETPRPTTDSSIT